MEAVNPAFVLRNYLVHRAISAAEEGDFGEVQQLLSMARTPYEV
jgi:uncharacterized protein YdiU (UPF0061 family)